MDRYEHKPTTDMLLHDLSRILKNESVNIRFPEHIRGQIEGPLERVHGAVDSFLEDNDLLDMTSQYSDDEYAMAEISQHQTWTEIIDALDGSEERRVLALIRMWGEKLVRLRTRQFEETRKRYYDECEAVINELDSEV